MTHLTQYRPQGPIDAVDFRTADGDRHTLHARLVVLACGAIENARLLLSSRTDGRQLGNEHETVGRFLMDHPLFSMGTIRGNTRQQLSALSFFDFTNRGGALAHGHVVTTEAFCRENESVQIGVCLFPRPADRHLRAIQAAQSVVRDPRTALASRSISASASNLRGGIGLLPQAAISSLLYRRSLLPGYGRGGWSRPGGPQLFDNVEVVFQCEQAPLASSRVTLSSEMDRFGSRLPSVHWQLGTQTARSALITQERIHKHLKMTEFGTYTPRAGNFDELARPASLAHHIGTTRMSRHPRDGVVDPDCRVHTAPNLFIAGSSVFPTSSYVNPTLTIAALSLRIASTVMHDLRSVSVSN